MAKLGTIKMSRISIQVHERLHKLVGFYLLQKGGVHDTLGAWDVETRCGRVHVHVPDGCYVPDLVTIFMRWKDPLRVLEHFYGVLYIPDGICGLNTHSGKWNIHVSGTGRFKEKRALETVVPQCAAEAWRQFHERMERVL